MLKKNNDYLGLVPVIKKMTQIESMLSGLKGKGKSFWTKAESIKVLNTTDFMLRMNKIIELRDYALRGHLEEEKIEEVIKECDEVLEILEHHKNINSIRVEIDLKLKIFEALYKKNHQIKLKKSIDIEEHNNIEYLAKRLAREEIRLLELKDYIKKYWIEKRLKPLGIWIGISLSILYLWSGYTYDR